MRDNYELHILTGKNEDLIDNPIVYSYETSIQRNLGYFEILRQLDYSNSVFIAVLDWREDGHLSWTKGTTQPIIFETMERGLMPINFCDAGIISLFEFNSYEESLFFVADLMELSTPNFWSDDSTNENLGEV